MKINSFFNGLMKTFSTATVITSQLVGLINVPLQPVSVSAQSTTTASDTVTVQEGCAITMTTTEKVEWLMPRTPIDFVVLQDRSGSFVDTINTIQGMVKEITTPVAWSDYDPADPHLVFTGQPETTDRVMIATYQGIDRIDYFSDAGYTRPQSNTTTTGKAYAFESTGLLSSKATINTELANRLTSSKAIGGTPTVPAIDDLIARYNSIKNTGLGTTSFAQQGRKTVFLLITDGVANGYRKPNQTTVTMDASLAVGNKLYSDWSIGTNRSEGTQDYYSRAQELVSAGTRLKAAAGTDGVVVVGYWESAKSLSALSQYGPAYLNPWNQTTDAPVRTPNRSVRSVFLEALKKTGSQDAADGTSSDPDGLKYYVDTNGDTSAAGQASFITQIKEAMKSALKTEDVVGNFTVTDGYRVKSVSINGKEIPTVVVDGQTQVSQPSTNTIPGTVTQTGTKVKISIPQSVFTAGNNTLTYNLERIDASTGGTSQTDDEANLPPETAPTDTSTIQSGQLKGSFIVGDTNKDGVKQDNELGFYETPKIGQADQQSVTYTKNSYCYL